MNEERKQKRLKHFTIHSSHLNDSNYKMVPSRKNLKKRVEETRKEKRRREVEGRKDILMESF